MKFTHPLPVEGPAFIILSLGGLDYVDLFGDINIKIITVWVHVGLV